MGIVATGRTVPRVKLVLKDKGQWISVFDPHECTLTVAVPIAPDIGEELRVDLAISEAGPRVIFRGRVISREAIEAGGDSCTVSLGTEEREKVNYVNGFVRGGLLNLRERRRLPLRLPCAYGGTTGPCKGFTRDINEEGLFLVSQTPLPEGTELHMRLELPTEKVPVELLGRVVHTVVVDDEDVPGMGIVFQLDQDQAATFTQHMDRLEAAFLKGAVPDEVLL